MQKLLETCCKLQGCLEIRILYLMCFIAKIEKALSIAYVVARGVAWGVACGYLFKNLEIFWNLGKFCRRRSPKHSLRANIFLNLPEA
ncbi:hypothetical protein T09_939 [Trichinella sp. T9]|nr:hypothetical protein T09_939 [Trichinella sp. T9]